MVDMGCITEDRELIETLWNVNLNENTKQMTELIELIETLWNVNTGTYPDIDKYALGINRNIVECKSRVT